MMSDEPPPDRLTAGEEGGGDGEAFVLEVLGVECRVSLSLHRHPTLTLSA
jgi:hypothetical protein